MTVPRDVKYERMNKIREVLEERPLSPGELFSSVEPQYTGKSNRRQHQRDLRGLMIQDLIYFEDGLYLSRDNKPEYNDAEYKIALNHSKQLILTSEGSQGFDQIMREAAAGTLASHPNPWLIEHLKTGYFYEIYQPLLKYRELKEKNPKIFNMRPKDVQVPVDIRQSDGPWFKAEECEIAVAANPEVVAEFCKLEGEITEKIYDLVGRVVNGNLLSGRCDACPLSHIKIKE
ncbi:hypothetical protein ES703_20310 [subsurface metagenome]